MSRSGDAGEIVTRLNDLVGLSRSLGRPERDLVILGEGNTPVRLDDERFLVKAIGTSLASAGRASFVEMNLRCTLALLDLENPADDELTEALIAARTSNEGGLRPSIEAVMHARIMSSGVLALGEPAYLTAEQADSLDTRPDEEYRRRVLRERR